jgi:hypothetical protein
MLKKDIYKPAKFCEAAPVMNTATDQLAVPSKLKLRQVFKTPFAKIEGQPVENSPGVWFKRILPNDCAYPVTVATHHGILKVYRGTATCLSDLGVLQTVDYMAAESTTFVATVNYKSEAGVNYVSVFTFSKANALAKPNWHYVKTTFNIGNDGCYNQIVRHEKTNNAEAKILMESFSESNAVCSWS